MRIRDIFKLTFLSILLISISKLHSVENLNFDGYFYGSFKSLLKTSSAIDPDEELFKTQNHYETIVSTNNLSFYNIESSFDLEYDFNEDKLDLVIDEFYFTRDFFDSYSFYMGRRILEWSVGYSFTPAGVTEPEKEIFDSNSAYKTSGFDIIGVDYYLGDASLHLVLASDYVKSDLEDKELSFSSKLYYYFNGVELSFISNIKEENDFKLGGNLVFTIGDNWEVHAETMFSEKEIVYSTYDLTNPFVSDDEKYYGEFLVGAVYTFDDGTTLMGEIFHDESGTDLDNYEKQVDFVLEQKNIMHNFVEESYEYQIAKANYHTFASDLIDRKSKTYSMIRWAGEYFDLNTELIVQTNLQDFSSLIKPSITKDLPNDFGLTFSSLIFVGESTSEYRIIPDDISMKISLTWAY